MKSTSFSVVELEHLNLKGRKATCVLCRIKGKCFSFPLSLIGTGVFVQASHCSICQFMSVGLNRNVICM